MPYSVKIALLVCLFISTSLVLSAQQEIDSIRIEGAVKSKVSYLSRFLDSQAGTAFNIIQAEKDVQRLRNLGNITNANFRIDSSGGKRHLVFEIEEAFTLFPLINFGGVEGNFWFQLGFSQSNWLGRGIQLTAYYQNNDRRNNYNFYAKMPYINGSRWGATFGFVRFASTEPLYFDDTTVFYDYNNTSWAVSGIYELQRNHFIEIGTTYFIEDYDKDERHLNEITPGPGGLRLPKLLVKIRHDINQIDYDYFHLAGLANSFTTQAVRNFDNSPTFLIAINDTRYFKRFGEKGNLAMRMRLGISTNKDTPFAPFVLDNYVNIRGSGNRVDRGTAAIILNTEYRQTIIDRKQVAAQIVAFSDMGTWRNPGGPFSDLKSSENFRHFVGGGIRFIYKRAFDAILRIDYGVDVYDSKQSGVVIGLGQYF